MRSTLSFSVPSAVMMPLPKRSDSASEGEAWLNILQYAAPLGGAAWALRGIFRQRVSRFIEIRRRGGAPPVAPIGPARAA